MNLSPLPIQKFFDNAGRPLVRGKLFTYEAGTDIKAATYIDSSGGTQNTNPIILDFRGECRLWIDPRQAYKFVLSPRSDTDPPTSPIWSVDDITAAPIAFDNAAVDTGPVNNIELSIPQISSPVVFTRIVFKAANTNTGPVTISINGGPAANLVWQNVATFTGGEVQQNGFYEAIYDGARWQLQGPTLLPTNMRSAAEILAGVTPTNYSIVNHTAQGLVHPARYGLSTAASAATNVAALQAAMDVVTAATTLKTYSGDLYGANTYTNPEVFIPQGVYDINQDIALPTAIVVRGDKTILNQTVATEDHFSSDSPYRVDIQGLTFHGGRRALTATGVSLNTARVRMSRCEFQTANTTNYAVLIDAGTMNSCFEDCLVLDSPLWLDVYGDFCQVLNCWVNGYLRSTGLKPDNTCSVNNRTRYMYVRGGSWVPQVDGIGSSTLTRWFNNGVGPDGGILVLQDVQFGAENAGLPIVYEFGNAAQASAQTHPYIALNGTIVRGCQLAQGAAGRADRGVIVLQGSVPSILEVSSGTFVVDGAIISDAGFTSPTLAEWLDANVGALYPRIAIDVEDVGEHGSTFVPAPLLPFARIRRKSRGFHPGFNNLGVINEPITEFFPNWQSTEAHCLNNVSGQKRDPASTTYFTALTASKEANETGGSGAALIRIDAVAQGEVSGPVGFVSSATFFVSLLATRTGNIQSVVTTAEQNNVDSGGGTSVGNVLQCQVTGTSTTTVDIQLRINTTITASSATVTWSAKMLSNTSSVNLPGRSFNLVSA